MLGSGRYERRKHDHTSPSPIAHHNVSSQGSGGIKQRTHPMCGFKRFVSAARFCRVCDEVRHFFRIRSQHNKSVLLAWCRVIQWAGPGLF